MYKEYLNLNINSEKNIDLNFPKKNQNQDNSNKGSFQTNNSNLNTYISEQCSNYLESSQENECELYLTNKKDEINIQNLQKLRIKNRNHNNGSNDLNYLSDEEKYDELLSVDQLEISSDGKMNNQSDPDILNSHEIEYIDIQEIKSPVRETPEKFTKLSNITDIAASKTFAKDSSPNMTEKYQQPYKEGIVYTNKTNTNEVPELNFAEKSPPNKCNPQNVKVTNKQLLNINPQKFQKVEHMTNEVLDFLVKDMLEDDDFQNCLVKKDPKNKNAYEGICKINNDVEEYLTIQIEKLSTEHFASVHRNLNIPLGPNPLKKLLLFSMIPGTEDETGNNFDYEPILDISIYIKLEELLKETIYVEKEYHTKQIEISHILHKLVFDCLNEGLDYQRIYGIKGIPLPTKDKKNLTTHISTNMCQKIINKCKNMVFYWNGYKCGTFIDNDPMLPIQSDPDICEIIREEALMKYQEHYIVNTEDKWIDYDDDEIEVSQELSETIFEFLINDTIESIFAIKKSRQDLVKPQSSKAIIKNRKMLMN